MQSTTLVVLACLVALAHSYPHYPAVDALEIPEAQETAPELVYDEPAYERSPRTKRGLILLKKKLLLGALGLKAAKIGGAAAGAAGVLAYKHHTSKPKFAYSPHLYHSYGYSSHGPTWNVEVHSWH